MFAIKAVASRTGLTTHTIRVWERRYEVISPERTESNRRLYSEKEVQKLILLKKAIDAGNSIGLLAKMEFEEIERLVQEQPVLESTPGSLFVDDSSPELFIKAALSASKKFDAAELESILNRANVQFSQPALIDAVLVPFLHQLGHRWLEGEYRVAHEHAATMVLRSFLGRLLSQAGSGVNGHRVVAATPPGTMHEFGAMLAALAAAAHGWRAFYLGPNLPVEDIAFSCRQLQAKALLLSIVYPPSDERVKNDLKMLRDLLSSKTAILVGGAAADSYGEILKHIDAAISPDFKSLPALLKKTASTQ